MPPTRQRILLLHVNGHVIRTTADHPFFVTGQGWTAASDLHVGDRLRNHDGQDVPVDAISKNGEQAVVYQMDASVPPFPCTGLLPAGTLLETADGLKPIENKGVRNLFPMAGSPGGWPGEATVTLIC